MVFFIFQVLSIFFSNRPISFLLPTGIVALKLGKKHLEVWLLARMSVSKIKQESISLLSMHCRSESTDMYLGNFSKYIQQWEKFIMCEGDVQMLCMVKFLDQFLNY